MTIVPGSLSHLSELLEPLLHKASFYIVVDDPLEYALPAHLFCLLTDTDVVHPFATDYGKFGKQLLEAKLKFIKILQTDNCRRTCCAVIFRRQVWEKVHKTII